jgi:hypothetical protein
MRFTNTVASGCRRKKTGRTWGISTTAVMQFSKPKNISPSPTAAITARMNVIQHNNQSRCPRDSLRSTLNTVRIQNTGDRSQFSPHRCRVKSKHKTEHTMQAGGLPHRKSCHSRPFPVIPAPSLSFPPLTCHSRESGNPLVASS